MSDQHAKPKPDSDCVFCCEILDNTNYVEYRATSTSAWKPSIYCQSCINDNFINKQWQNYIELIDKADCAAALKRVITLPPPQRVRDKGLPCEESETNEVHDFWYNSDGQIHSAELKDALTGDARLKFWQEKLDYMHALEVSEAQDKK